jgi:hypothetical protein
VREHQKFSAGIAIGTTLVGMAILDGLARQREAAYDQRVALRREQAGLQDDLLRHDLLRNQLLRLRLAELEAEDE